jgi:integrase
MTKQKNVIVEVFAKTDLSQQSKNAYINRLAAIDPSGGTSGINYFTDTDTILNKLSNMSDNAKKGTIAAILSLFKYYGKTSGKIDKARGVYKSELMNINTKIQSKSNELSESGKENWVSREDVTKKLNSYGRKFRKIIKKEPKELTDDEYKTLLEYVILSLYTMNPPRRERDYFLMFINSNKFNELDMEKQQFIFRDYKDMKALGEQIIDIPNKLFNVIKEYVRITSDRFQIDEDKPIKFLVKPSGRFILRGDIRKYLSNVFGKNVGATSLRRTFATVKYKNKTDQMKQDAYEMGTSSYQMKNHYIKNNVDD